MSEEWNIEIDSSNPVQNEHKDAASLHEAVHSYVEARSQYGGGSLRVPDGKIERSHYAFPTQRGTERIPHSLRGGHHRSRGVPGGPGGRYGASRPGEEYASSTDTPRMTMKEWFKAVFKWW